MPRRIRDWELIVVDDCSTDGTAAIAQAYADPRIRLLKQAKNSGPGAARMAGTVAASHGLICYLDSDDRLTPRAMEVLGKALQHAPEAVLAYADFVRIDAQGQRYGLRRFVRPSCRSSGDMLEQSLQKTLIAERRLRFGAAAIGH
ncbi:MAG: glycosyltransferase family A protein [Alphaproteobacteria bacterium]